MYVGNMPFSATEDDLRSLFEAHGSVRRFDGLPITPEYILRGLGEQNPGGEEA